MGDAKTNVLEMLFQEHHRQLVAKRLKMHNVTEKTLTLFLIIGGWLVVGKDPMTSGVRWVIIGVVVVVGTSACISIWSNNRSYYQVRIVMGRINEALGLFEHGKFLDGVAIYPPNWKHKESEQQTEKRKGKAKQRTWQQGELKGFFFHCLTIAAAGVLCVFAALMRQ